MQVLALKLLSITTTPTSVTMNSAKRRKTSHDVPKKKKPVVAKKVEEAKEVEESPQPSPEPSTEEESATVEEPSAEEAPVTPKTFKDLVRQFQHFLDQFETNCDTGYRRRIMRSLCIPQLQVPDPDSRTIYPHRPTRPRHYRPRRDW